MIDLHTHTTASDGEYSPKDLIALAKKIQLKTIAITDHDTIGGLSEACVSCKNLDIKLIKGIELNIAFSGQGEFHLLGYGLENITQQMQDLIQTAQKKRLTRNLEITKKINAFGINCTYQQMTDYAVLHTGLLNTLNFGRPHFADFLVSLKKARNRNEAFAKYLATGKPFFVRNTGVNIQDAINAISSCGGVAVLAHPLSLHISMGHLSDLLDALKQKGLCGIEAWHSGAKIPQAQKLESLARQKGLFVTAGSDFHGAKLKPDRFLGHTTEGIPIENRFYFRELLPALNI